MSHLLAQLQRSGAVEPPQLEAALRRQQIYGGSLDTIMLELELLSAHRLHDELALATGLPVASDTWIERREDRPWDRLPAELVELGWVVALGVEDGRPVVAVHPELPDEELARLKRLLPAAIVMVTPECCLATVAAERTGSVMPQRYAVLAAAYLAEHRRARVRKPAPASPSPTQLSVPKGPAPAPWLAVTPPSQDRPLVAVATANLAAQTPATASARPETSPAMSPMGTLIQPPARAPVAPAKTGPLASAEPVARPNPPRPAADPFAAAAQAQLERSPATSSAPSTRTPEERQADLLARVAPLQQALLAAEQRDEVTDLLLKCAAQLSPRVALFGVKKEGLKGLAGLHTLHEITQEIVEPGAALEEALAGQGRVEEVRDLGLRMAVRQGAAVPCIFQPIRVRDRAVLVLYLDRDGARFEAFERELATTLAGQAGDRLEQVLRKLRGEAASPAATTVSAKPAASPSADAPVRPSEPVPPVSQVQPVAAPPATSAAVPALDPVPATPAPAPASAAAATTGESPQAAGGAPPASIRLASTLNGAVPPTPATTAGTSGSEVKAGKRPLFAPPPRPGQGGADDSKSALPGTRVAPSPGNTERGKASPAPAGPPFAPPEGATPAPSGVATAEAGASAPVRPGASSPTSGTAEGGIAKGGIAEGGIAEGAAIVGRPPVAGAPLSGEALPKSPLVGGRGPLRGSGGSPGGLEVAPVESVRRLPTELRAGPTITTSDEPRQSGEEDTATRPLSASTPGNGPVPLDAPTPIELHKPVVGPPPDRAAAAPPTSGPIAALLAMPRLVSTAPGPAAGPSPLAPESAAASNALAAKQDAPGRAHPPATRDQHDDPLAQTANAATPSIPRLVANPPPERATTLVDARVSIPRVGALDDTVGQGAVPLQSPLSVKAPPIRNPRAGGHSGAAEGIVGVPRDDDDDDASSLPVSGITEPRLPAYDVVRRAVAQRPPPDEESLIRSHVTMLASPPPVAPPPPPSFNATRSSTRSPAVTEPALIPPPRDARPGRSGAVTHAEPTDQEPLGGPDTTLVGATPNPPRAVAGPHASASSGARAPASKPFSASSGRTRIELDDEERVDQASDSLTARIDECISRVMRREADTRELGAFGDQALLRIASRFPGPLDIIRRDLDSLAPPSAHGSLLRLCISLGHHISSHLIELLDHGGTEVRFFASFIFQELRDDACVAHLANRAFDTDGDIRVVAMRVLETYNRSPAFPTACEQIRRQLDSDSGIRQLQATRAVGTLRDVASVERLIDLLSSRDRTTQESALESLCTITGQQLGLKPHKWRAWLTAHGHEHRVEWIMSGLEHADAGVRRWSFDELRRITGHHIDFPVTGDRADRDAALAQWRAWWATAQHRVRGTTR